jgi:hypothetical protein
MNSVSIASLPRARAVAAAAATSLELASAGAAVGVMACVAVDLTSCGRAAAARPVMLGRARRRPAAITDLNGRI